MLDAVRAGRHVMMTPWRQLVLVHAVARPLTVPALSPPGASKTTIWQTAARLSIALTVDRRSTASVDIAGAWTQPVDDGESGADPGAGAVHLAGLLVRGRPRVRAEPWADSFEMTGHHEFGDTRHRRVAYTATATSRFVEYFRAEKPLTLAGAAAVPSTCSPPYNRPQCRSRDAPGTAPSTGPAPPGEEDPATAAGDFLVQADGLLRRTAGSTIPAAGQVVVSYVEPEIHTVSPPTTTVVVPSSARPAAPVVRYVVPAFRWDQSGSTHTRRAGLRMYLRPSMVVVGEGDCSLGDRAGPAWNGKPPKASARHVTMIGNDPTVASPAGPAASPSPRSPWPYGAARACPCPRCPVRRCRSPGTPWTTTCRAGCGSATSRSRRPAGPRSSAYFPFVRLALARYQPDSMPECHLSPVVLADFTQLAPDRSLTVVPRRGRRDQSPWSGRRTP